VWLDNLDFVHSHNQRGGSYWVRAPNACKQPFTWAPYLLSRAARTCHSRLSAQAARTQLGLNALADWTHAEYKQHMLGYR